MFMSGYSRSMRRACDQEASLLPPGMLVLNVSPSGMSWAFGSSGPQRVTRPSAAVIAIARSSAAKVFLQAVSRFDVATRAGLPSPDALRDSARPARPRHRMRRNIRPGEQVRSSVRQLVADAHAHRWGDYCAASTNPDKCQGAIATAKALGVDAAEFVPSKDVLENMRVTVHGDRATVDATAGKDAQWVRRGGRWLWVWTGS
jgi:hypothetical protein